MDPFQSKYCARKPIRDDVRIDGLNAERIEREIQASKAEPSQIWHNKCFGVSFVYNME
jgi:hypothetical protein